VISLRERELEAYIAKNLSLPIFNKKKCGLPINLYKKLAANYQEMS
jgi:hypothetical protein